MGTSKKKRKIVAGGERISEVHTVPAEEKKDESVPAESPEFESIEPESPKKIKTYDPERGYIEVPVKEEKIK